MEQSAEHTKAVHSSPWKSSVSKRVIPELDFVLGFFVIVCFDFLDRASSFYSFRNLFAFLAVCFEKEILIIGSAPGK